MRAKTILIRAARQLLTLHGPRGYRRGTSLADLSVIADGALLIRDGLVLQAGSSRRVENLAEARSAVEVNASGRVVMPGFVDSHTHLLFPSPGAQEEEAAKMLRTVTARRIASRVRPWLAAMARHGSTTIEVKTGSGADETTESKLLRAAAALDGDPIAVTPTFQLRIPRERGAEAVEWAIEEFLPLVKRRSLARFAEICCDGRGQHGEEGGVGRFLRAARNLGLPAKIHGTAAAHSQAIREGVANLAVNIGHWEGATTGDIACMAGAGTMATASPGMWMEGGAVPPVRQLIDAGVPVALATDFAPHAPRSLSMQTVIGLAVRLMGMTVEEAISASTVNGAHALGLGGKLGTLEPGMSADLLILNASDYRDLAFHYGSNLVAVTMKGGEFIWHETAVERLQPEILRGVR